ncbi:MAG: PAS domain S-box protein [Cyanosarcina radialis HA8281-LM2]|nr:PAS domain S-box protein [Cyanosarcina radialis HA8281-LM2]
MKVGRKFTGSDRLLAYGVALLAVALAIGISLWLSPAIEPTPTSLFFIAVTVSAWYGGLRPGLVATILSTLAINYYFIDPYYSLKIAEPGSLLRLGTFVVAAVLIGGLNESHRSALHREQRLRAVTEAAQGESRAAKERLETLLSSISDGFYTLDRHWCYTYANDRYCQMAGRQREALLDQNIWEVFPDAVDTDFYLQLQRSAIEQKPLQFEYLYAPSNRWYEHRVYPAADGVTVFIADITARKQVQEALRQSEEQLRLASAGANLGLWHWDVKKDVLSWTDRCKALFGLPADTKMSYQVFLNALHPEDRQRIHEMRPRLEDGQLGCHEIEYRTVWPDGTVHWLAARGNAIYDGKGEPRSSMGVIFDITDRKQAEIALSQSETILNAFIASSPVGMAFFDRDGRYIYANEALAAINGIPLSEHLGRTLEEVLPQWAPTVEPIFRQVMQTRMPLLNQEVVGATHPADLVKHCLVNYFPVCLPDGEVIGVGVTDLDITDRKQAEAALHHSEEQLRLATAGANLGMWYWDLATDTLTWTDRAKAMFGLAVDTEMSMQVFLNAVHPDDRQSVQTIVSDLQAGRTHTEDEYRTLWPDGTVRWILARGNFTYNADGILASTRGVLMDITDRKQAEADLREREKELRLVTDAVPALISFIDTQRRYRFNNRGYEEWFGHSAASVYGRTLWDVLGEPAYSAIQPYVDRVLAGERVTFESLVPYQDGGQRYISATYVPRFDDRGQVAGFVALVSDISDRQRVENALRQSEERFRSIVNQVIVGIAQTDLTGQFVLVNQRYCDIVGYTQDELLQMRVQDITHPDDLPHNLELFQRLAAEGREFVIEKRYLRQDGSEVWVNNSVCAVRDERGRSQFAVAVVVDISDRKRREQNAEFMARIGQNLTLSSNTDGLFASLSEEMCRYLDFAMLTLAEIDDAAERATVIYDRRHPEVQEARGEHRLADYLSDSQIEQLKTGKSIAIDDVSTLDIPTGDAAYRQFQARSTLIAPYVSDGRLRFLISGSRYAPSRWRADEIDLMSELAARIWIRVERARAEENLRRSEAAFRTISNAAPALVWVCSPSGENIFFNDRWYEFTGQTPDEARGRGWANAMHAEDAAQILSYWERCQQTGETYEGEVRYRGRDGEYRWHVFRALPHRNANGQIEAWYGLSFDISDRKQSETALRESERRFRRLVESNMFGVAFGDFSGGIHYVNDYFLNMVGYTRAEIETGQVRWIDITPTEFLPLDERAMAEMTIAGVATPFEKEYIRKDGTRVPILIGAALLEEPYARQQEMIAFYVDLTERQQTEKALREALQKLNFHVENTPMAVIEWNQDLQVARWSGAAEQIFGWSAREVLGESLADLNLVFEEDIKHVAEVSRQLMFGEESYIFSYNRNYTKSGDVIYCEWYNSSLRDRSGQMISVLSLVLDVTARQQVETLLRDSEDRLRMAIESARLGTWDWNLVTNELIWDPGCKAMFGLPPDAETSIEIFYQGLHPDDRDRLQESMRQVLNPESSGHYDGEYRTIGITDGIERWVAAKGQVYFNSAREPVRFIGTVLEITDRKRLAAERERLLQRERAAREEAERANRIKDEFLAVLSHELRSPLNPILGWTRLLQTRQFTPEKTAEALAAIERNAKLQSQLIEDLLDVSRILRGKMALNICPVNLVATIQAAIDTVRLAAEAKNIHIQTQLDPDVAIVSGDPTRLQQIIWNLLTNAVKFTSQGGRVEVRLDRVDCFAQIQIRDTGKGISPDFLPYVFDYFRQEDGAITRKFGGLGLGLAIVRHLTEQHGGTIEVDSPGEGLGATFTLRLPLPAANGETPQEPAAGDEPLDLKGVKILVVDDEADMRELMVTMLETYGAEVSLAASAREALKILVQTQPDTLISDLGMPDVDGYMLMRQIRTLPPNRGGQIPAIALTAYAGEIDRQQAIAAGFQQHLPKPVEPEALIRAIGALGFLQKSGRGKG